jgi:alginate O-acetyltransferase complex protein AlgI
MLFNSPEFIVLLLITFLVYYIPEFTRFQVIILILSSFIFYAYGQPVLLLLLLFSASINIFTSFKVVNGLPSRRKFYAVLGVVINLLVLACFKYSPLFSRSFLDTSKGLGYFLVMIPLPIGISFYTFEGISLLVDVYSNKHRDTFALKGPIRDHIVKTLFFISFFPHLIAGPILKAYQFYPQIGIKKFREIDWNYVFRRLTLGYFLKMVVADNLSNFTFWMTYPYFKLQSTVGLITMLFGYSCQIFADFAGYSLIALGLAKIFGYSLMENFNFPYISASFSEFWKRWHISLSTFLKEYLYIPLGGNRKGNIRTYVNLLVTMILGGLWHGAAWSYAVWGGFHGAALATERFVANRTRAIKKGLIISWIRRLIVFSFVTLAWLLFRLPFGNVIEYLKTITTNVHTKIDYLFLLLILVYSMPVVLYHLNYLVPSYWRIKESLVRYQYVTYGFLLFMIIVNSGPSGSFIYFQF